MLLKKCEGRVGRGSPSQQCSVEIPFLACVAHAEFTGLCIIGCFYQGGSNYATLDLVTDELCTWASLRMTGLYYSMVLPWKYENSSIHPMYKLMMASEEDVCIPALMECAGTMG